MIISTDSGSTIQKEIRSMRRHAKELLKSKKKSREFLIRAGIITKSGKLAKAYRHTG